MSSSSASGSSVSHLAYKKLVLHTAKYPTARVFGFLVGKSGSDGAFSIVDAIPLSHHWTSLAPMAEAGLSLASAYISTKDLSVIGIYEAPELVGQREPSAQSAKLAEKIATLNGRDSLLLLINNSTLLHPTNHSLIPHLVSPPSSNNPAAAAKPKSLPTSAVSLVDPTKAKSLEDDVRKSRSWQLLHDFDDHLEDPSLDWLQNTAISA
ncbi:UPF0172-domain-containing protein [Testicularia cyperi]|uniref:UPF0172-domain-containing protein n=1 Tax=Testicularia cyperi TaxID=1882483 RepID=A0A317XI23_9BASI|nr:UPF0172-domain-containing protein [Testicularia cyperi]